jgi:hypothetical protein
MHSWLVRCGQGARVLIALALPAFPDTVRGGNLTYSFPLFRPARSGHVQRCDMPAIALRCSGQIDRHLAPRFPPPQTPVAPSRIHRYHPPRLRGACVDLAAATRRRHSKPTRGQARNTDAERKAADVRLRAERRAGELLAELARGEGAREPGTNRGATPSNGATPSPYAAALESTGTSRQTAHRYQALAAIPKDTFDARSGRSLTYPTNSV